MTTIETERLLLRQFDEKDLDAFAGIVADPEVMRFMGGPRDRASAWSDMARMLGHWALRGYGLWAVEDKRDGALLGRAGLWRPEGWPGLEIGWLIARDRWGQGLATEAARASVDYAFDGVGVERVISLINPANTASIRVAEKLGERLESRTELTGEDVLVYGMDRKR